MSSSPTVIEKFFEKRKKKYINLITDGNERDDFELIFSVIS